MSFDIYYAAANPSAADAALAQAAGCKIAWWVNSNAFRSPRDARGMGGALAGKPYQPIDWLGPNGQTWPQAPLSPPVLGCAGVFDPEILEQTLEYRALGLSRDFDEAAPDLPLIFIVRWGYTFDYGNIQWRARDLAVDPQVDQEAANEASWLSRYWGGNPWDQLIAAPAMYGFNPQDRTAITGKTVDDIAVTLDWLEGNGAVADSYPFSVQRPVTDWPIMPLVYRAAWAPAMWPAVAASLTRRANGTLRPGVLVWDDGGWPACAPFVAAIKAAVGLVVNVVPVANQ